MPENPEPRLPTWRDVTARFNRRHRTAFNVKTVQVWERQARRKMLRMLRADPQLRRLVRH